MNTLGGSTEFAKRDLRGRARRDSGPLRVQNEADELVEKYGDVALSDFARQVGELNPARRRQLERLARNS